MYYVSVHTAYLSIFSINPKQKKILRRYLNNPKKMTSVKWNAMYTVSSDIRPVPSEDELFPPPPPLPPPSSYLALRLIFGPWPPSWRRSETIEFA